MNRRIAKKIGRARCLKGYTSDQIDRALLMWKRAYRRRNGITEPPSVRRSSFAVWRSRTALYPMSRLQLEVCRRDMHRASRRPYQPPVMIVSPRLHEQLVELGFDLAPPAPAR